MIETKLVSVWEIGIYLIQGWVQTTPINNGKALMQRTTLIKGVGNAALFSDLRPAS